MSQALRKLTANIHKSNCAMVFINQVRMKIGVMFGSPETTTGGNALKFYSSIRLDIRRVGTLKQGEEPIGNRTRVKVVKNKLAPPFRQVEFDILYGKGVNQEGELIDLGVDLGIVRKSGSWFAYGEERIGQGRDKAVLYLTERPELRERLRSEIMNRGDAAVTVVSGASAEA
jgi:recombination protein RecA